MERKEVRAGNYVKYRNRVIKLSWWRANFGSLKELEPMPLTQDVMDKCRFRVDLAEVEEFPNIRYHPESQTASVISTNKEQGRIFDALHQLQNLWRDWTGKRLEVNL